MSVQRIEKACKKTKRPSLAVLDSEFSKWIKARDNYTCQRCRREHATNSCGLHNSHYIGRSNRTVRWDPENCDAMCNGCHGWMEARKPTDYRDWKIAQLGEAGHDALLVRSRPVKKWTPDELIELRAGWKSSQKETG